MTYTKIYSIREISFEAAVLIYLEGLAISEKCTLSDIINKLGREKAMEEFKPVQLYTSRKPYRPDTNCDCEIIHSKSEGNLFSDNIFGATN